MIDLHVHTTASDGQYTPTQIIQKAKELSLNAIAVTDHDTIAGLEEAKKEAVQQNINFIPGIEISITYSRGEFHLLGLGISEPSESMISLVENVQKNRTQRNLNIIEKMNNDGLKISLDDIEKEFPNTVIGRPHFAAYLEKIGVVKKRQQAFDKYLARGKPWYCEKIGSNLDEAIVAIYESKGVPVLAHPMSLYLSWGKIPDALKDYKERGIMGLEAFHPGARMTDCLRLEETGRKLGYFITASSDFHGEKVRPDRKLGHTAGGKIIEDRFWTEELKPALNSQMTDDAIQQ